MDRHHEKRNKKRGHYCPEFTTLCNKK
uniref:Uncharacterized protein n=1 Tax=Rhizophora mucronata TaxID=61149 RepID=A0A2P2R0R8_RHIMU